MTIPPGGLSYKKTFCPDRDKISAARSLAEKKAEQLGFEELRDAISFVLGEMIQDSILHGMGDQTQENITVQIFVSKEEIVICVIDPCLGASKKSLEREEDTKGRGNSIIEGLGFKYSRSLLDDGRTIAKAKKEVA